MGISEILIKQREFFNSNTTKDLDFRLEKLNKLRELLEIYEGDIFDALNKDLNKSNTETYVTEMGLVYEELSNTIKKLPKWTKAKGVMTSIAHFYSKSYIHSEPYGVSLIVSPWNYPLQLSIIPLIGSISAGNCSILKLSQKSKNTSKILEQIINENFSAEYIKVIDSSKISNDELLREKYDYIFFTGSTKVGKTVMEAAAKNLTPLTLELGGKSPCIVDSSANIPLSAKRITWGKFLNAGQTCVAPDYILAHKSVSKDLIANISKSLFEFFGGDILGNPEYPKIITKEHFDRLLELMNEGVLEFGGNSNVESQKIEPTVISNIDWDSKIMEEEIFGPILPIIEYEDLDEVIEKIKSRPKPLALYIFTEDNGIKNKITREISFGSGCINDTLIQLSNPNLPFGGVGDSGLGKYHGKYSFDTFSNKKGILEKSNLFDIPLRYPPYKNKLDIIKKILK